MTEDLSVRGAEVGAEPQMSRAPALVASIVANEILPGGADVRVSSPEPLDPRSAQAAIGLVGERTLIRLSEDGRTATVLTPDGLNPGPGVHTLFIDEVLSSDSERLGEGLRIPFLVSDTVADIARDLRLDTMVRLTVDELSVTRRRPDRRVAGAHVERVKAVHRTTGEPLELGFDESGNRVDPEEVLAGVTRRRREKFGKLQEDLYARIERDPAEPVLVAVWLNTPGSGTRGEKSSAGATPEPTEDERRRSADARSVTGRVARLAREELGAEISDPDPDAPMFLATLPGERVAALAEYDDVAAVYLHDETVILDLGTSMAVANSDDVQAQGFDGTGTSAAVWEDGPDQVNLLPIVATFDPAFVGTSQHARHTHAIVANTEAGQPHGHAPSCRLHSANRGSIEALRWAARDRGCTVISQSFHRSTEPGSANLQSDDIYKDWLALQWPYPTIVQAAGNYWSGDPDGITPPSTEYVNHKTYNGLVVGNHDDSASAMSGDSVFRNPASPRGDRELPEIAANGTAVTTVGLTMSGTSMAAPAAAGCAALLQDADPTLQSWPEGCRAILLAGARRTPGSDSWWTDVQQREDVAQGAGAVDAQASLSITQSRRFRDAKATSRGWDVGTLRTSDIGKNRETTFSYNVIAPMLVYRPAVTVALAWDSAVTTGADGAPLTSSLNLDLDLLVYDGAGNLVAQSSSYDNSYEVVDFACRPGSQFTVKIRRWSGTDDVWYGIAWKVSSRPPFVAVSNVGVAAVRE